MEYLKQGTIIYGFKSHKYNENVSYAVIISARCDIANDKISKLYYLSAVDAKAWFVSEAGFHVVYDDYINNVRNDFKQILTKYKLDSELLLKFPLKKGISVLTEYEENQSKLNKLIEKYTRTYNICSGCLDVDKKTKIIHDNPKNMINFLDQITKGNMNHYFYLPHSAYSLGGEMHEGLIVDLQEIGILTIEDAKQIKSPGIDFRLLDKMNELERKRLQDTYWLQDDTCFVDVEATISSPWCELLMQRFSNDFIRIGVDGANKNDFEKLVELV